MSDIDSGVIVRNERQHGVLRAFVVAVGPAASLATLAVAFGFYVQVTSFMAAYNTELDHQRAFNASVTRFMDRGGRVTDDTLTKRLEPFSDTDNAILNQIVAERESTTEVWKRILELEKQQAVIKSEITRMIR